MEKPNRPEQISKSGRKNPDPCGFVRIKNETSHLEATSFKSEPTSQTSTARRNDQQPVIRVRRVNENFKPNISLNQVIDSLRQKLVRPKQESDQQAPSSRLASFTLPNILRKQKRV